MKNVVRYFFSLLLCSVLFSCDVQEKKKGEMATNLYATLTNEFMKQDAFDDMYLGVDLKSIEHEPFRFLEKGYKGQFSCTFKDGKNEVRMFGFVGFDEDGFVAKMPARFGDKIAIEISVVLVNSKNVPVSECVYNIPSFISH